MPGQDGTEYLPGMTTTRPPKRLILRAVLRDVSSMIVRLISVSDQMDLESLHDAFQAILGWSGDLGYIGERQQVGGHAARVCGCLGGTGARALPG